MLVLIKGAGDIASGIALRLFRANIAVAMTELERPTAIRRGVCFSEAARLGEAEVEGIRALRANSPDEARAILSRGLIPVLAGQSARSALELRPDALVDAILAKRNTGTKITDAKAVVAVGPGFFAGRDCHAVVETKRGHTLGRVILSGSAIADTGIPGNIGGYTTERVLRAPKAGLFTPLMEIGDFVEAGQPVAEVGGEYVYSGISGVLRGLLPEGSEVFAGMKSGDVDPRGRREYCYTVSDKALAVAGGVLEAIGGILWTK